MHKRPPNAAQKLARLQAQLPNDRAEMLQHLLQYAHTDLLCYRAPKKELNTLVPTQSHVLRARQEKHFNPIMDWLREQGMEFAVTDGLMPVAQPQQSIDILAAIFATANDRELAALSLIVPPLGSALLALVLWKKMVSVEEALLLARLDEDFQAEQWGEDLQAAANWALKVEDIREAAIFLDT